MLGNRQNKQQAFAITPIQSTSSGGISPMVWVIAVIFGIAVFATAQENAEPETCTEERKYEAVCNMHPSSFE